MEQELTGPRVTFHDDLVRWVGEREGRVARMEQLVVTIATTSTKTSASWLRFFLTSSGEKEKCDG